MNTKGYVISDVAGVEVYVDKYIAKDNALYFCSCFKGSESVVGAQGGFLSGTSWNIEGFSYERLRNCNYKQMGVKLNPAITHGIVFVKDFFDGTNVMQVNVVFGDSMEEIKEKAFIRLKKATSVPLLDEWRDEILDETVSFLPLTVFGFGFAYEIELPKDEILKDYVMTNLDVLTGK